jgi:gliding motility-associated-like protein
MNKTIIQQISKKCIIAVVALLPALGFAQLSVTVNTSATTLAQTIVGSGVAVGSASLNCGIHSSGTFTDASPDLGLSNGIILCNGYAVDAGNPAVFASYNEGITYSDPYLLSIDAQAKYDVCILTFTFVPVCSSISIKYVFGSEEYPQAINQYNDGFGIFLNGPNPGGGNYVGTNIAALPDGHNTPVSIDSVNGGYSTAQGASVTIAPSNPTYFVNNFTYDGTNYTNAGNGELSYHGYTIPVTSSASVTPCQTYTMEIAIADGGNHVYDSGVFIQGNSVGCTIAPVVTAATTATGCGGASSTGSATATVTNFLGTVTYSWSPGGQTTQSISGLPAGTYTCKVGLDCSTTTFTTVTAVVTSPAPPTVSVASSTVCSGSNASITASGVSTYTWNTGATGATLTVPTVTANATYTVTGTSAAGCTNTATGSVSINAPPIVTASSSTICAGAAGTLTAGGATSYTWNTGATGASISPSPTVTTTYTVTGTNASSCTNTATGTVTVNSLPIVAATNTTLCIGSSVILTASGANTYTWNTGATTTTISVNPTSATSYTVTGTSTAGCTNTAVAAVTISALPTITIPNDSICKNSTGTLVANGANTYTWNTGATGATYTVANVSSNTTYTVTGTNASSCTNTAVGNIIVRNIVVNVPPSTICLGSTATLTASGANTYTWSTGSNATNITVTPTVTTSYSVTGTNAFGCVSNVAVATINVISGSSNITVTPTKSVACSGIADTLNAVGASTYTWTASDGTIISTNGSQVIITQTANVTYTVTGSLGGSCLATPTIVTVNTNPPVTLTITPTPTNVVCPGNAITLTATGANTYTWTPSITNGVAFIPASSQTYSVIGTNANGCIGSNNISVTVNTLSITATASSASLCAGGTATLTAGGGTSYAWTPSVTSISGSANSQVTTGTAATYTVVGTLGTCIDSSTVTLNNAPPTVISISASPSATICAGETTVLTASGASTYTWSTLATTSSINASPTTSQAYTVVGTDANGCLGFSIQPVTVNPLPTLIISPTSSSLCLGQSAILSASGANTYTWSTGATPTSTISVSPSSAGVQTYSVSGTDGNGCVSSSSAVATVNVNPLPTITIVSIPSGYTVCAGNTTTLTASGASTYTWSNGDLFNTNIVSPTTNPTSYTVIGTDVNNCVNTSTVSISVSQPPNMPTITGNTVVCWNTPTVLTATDAINGLNYIWIGPAPSTNTVSNSSSASITTSGSYTLIATNTCGNSQTIETLIGDTVKAYITKPVSPSTGFAPDTVAFMGQGTSTNGTIVGYHWNFGDGDTSNIQNPSEIYTAPSLSVNTYTAILMAFDNNGCWDTASVKIIVNEVPTVIIIPNIFSPNGDGINDIFFITATGISNFDCKVYDRWGLLLHEWTGIDGGWDGKSKNGNNCTDGTYFYIINYDNNQGKSVNKDGFFELIR